MRAFSERAGLESVDMLTDVVRRDCIALIRKSVDRDRRTRGKETI
jgi:hypothetical protein